MRSGLFSSSIGPGYLFPAIAAVFLGASQFQQRANVWGTLIAYFALAFGIQGLALSSSSGAVWSQPLFEGVALIVAVAFASRPAVRQVARTRSGARRRTAQGDDRQARGETPMTPLLEIRGLARRSRARKALDAVDLDILPGEIHALVGQNGSGKSTLIKVLAGYHQPDPGAGRARRRAVRAARHDARATPGCASCTRTSASSSR